MLRNKKVIGLITAGFIGVGSAFSGVAVTGATQEMTVYAAADVDINATNFPDKIFRKYVSDNIDKDKDGKLSEKEISACEKIDCSGKEISSLKGIEFFTALKDLNCLGNNLEILDLSKNVALNSLNGGMNNLVKLDVSKNCELEYLYLNGNMLNSLDISKNVALKDLECLGNELSVLDVSKNIKLERLYCYGNKLKKLDVSKNADLKELYCTINYLSKIDLSKNVALKRVSLNCNALTSLDLSKNKALTDVDSEDQNKDVTCKNGEIILSDMDPDINPANITNLKGATLSGGKFINITGNTITYDYNIGYKNQKMNVILNVKGVKKIGWKKEGNGYKYYKNDKAYTGWHWMTSEEGEKTPHWSYFGKDGLIYTGWHWMSSKEGEKTPHYSYFGGNGWLRTGWQVMGKGTGNAYGENTAKHLSYFGGDGWLRRGWQVMGKGTGNAYGENTAKHLSYFGGNGWMRTGMQTMGTNINPDGNCKQHLSFFDVNGWLVANGSFSYNGSYYFADARGWANEDENLVKAIQFISKVTNKNMSNKEKLLKCYNYIQEKSVFKSPWIPHYRGNDWPKKYANNYFNTMSGNCFSYAAALGYIAKALGYENVYCCNGKTHGWVEINGLIYDTSRGYRGISYAQKAYYNYKGMISAGEAWMRVKL